MVESRKQRLIREFEESTLLAGTTITEEERLKLIAMGAESGIRDEDLPLRLGDVFAGRFSESMETECSNLMKGHIVQMAGERGVTADHLIKIIHNFMGTNTDNRHTYDA